MDVAAAALALALFGQAPQAVQMLDAQTLAAVQRVMPHIEDAEYRQKLDEAIYYDKTSLGVAYQVGTTIEADEEPIGFASANLNISNDFPENQKAHGVGGNPNTSSHFPWPQKPGGTHRCTNVDAVTAFWLPKKPDGTYWPVVHYPWEVPKLFNQNQTVTALNWTFPEGTHFFELIYLRAPDGEIYCFEVRVRSRDIDAWIGDVLRPFPESEDLVRAITHDEERNWRSVPSLVRLVNHLQDPGTLRDGVLRDRNDTEKAFNVQAGVDNLPAVDDWTLIGELLDRTPFTSAMGAVWRSGEGLPAFAPTTDAEFHIVPQNYDGTFLGTDIESCSRCHDTSLTSSRRWDASIGWYGYVRGNRVVKEKGGGILSWHGLEKESLGLVASPPVFNQKWLQAGVIAEYNENAHPPSRYRRLTSAD